MSSSPDQIRSKAKLAAEDFELTLEDLVQLAESEADWPRHDIAVANLELVREFRRDMDALEEDG